MSALAPIFSTAALQRQVDSLLGGIPEGKKGCLVAVHAGDGWIELLTMVKINETWQVAGRLRHEQAHGTTVSCEVRAVW
jgi:hypothetical protein